MVQWSLLRRLLIYPSYVHYFVIRKSLRLAPRKRVKVLFKPIHFFSKYTDAPARNNSETPITSHFSLIPLYKTMGCFLNKVASSSLVSLLFIILFLALHMKLKSYIIFN